MRIDPKRINMPQTGIPIRAQLNERWGTYDIVNLDKPSLVAWMRERNCAEEIVLLLLLHERET